MAATRSMMSTSYTIPPPVSLSATWMGLGWGLSILRTGSDLNHYNIMYFFHSYTQSIQNGMSCYIKVCLM